MRQQPSERQAANDAAADTDHKGACFLYQNDKTPRSSGSFLPDNQGVHFYFII